MGALARPLCIEDPGAFRGGIGEPELLRCGKGVSEVFASGEQGTARGLCDSTNWVVGLGFSTVFDPETGLDRQL